MPVASAPPADLFPAADLLETLLDASRAGVALYTPVHDSAGDVSDFVFVHLNPAAQRLLQLPAQPAATYCQQFPQSLADGSFAFLRDAFLSGKAGHAELSYHVEGNTQHVQAAIRRVGAGLLLSFTEAATARPEAEQALRASQAREQEARLAAERERNVLQALLAQAPVAIGLFQGDDQLVAIVNNQLCAMWDCRAEQVLGKPLLVGVPELQGQGFTELLAEVARTRVPFVGTEVAAQIRQHGRLETNYFNFVYQPLYDPEGGLLGVLDIAIDVTAQVVARQQVQRLNEELAVANEELQAANGEFLTANTALTLAQKQLAQERETLHQVFAQTPALIAMVSGPNLTFTFVNPAYQQFFAGRQLLGRPYAEALPEVHRQDFGRQLHQVYTTGKSFVGTEAPLLFPTADGGERQAYFDFTYEPYGRPQPEGIFIFAFEATERVLTRQQQAAYQQLRAVFEQVPVAMSVLQGPDYRIEVANPFITDLWDRPMGILLGQPFFKVLPELHEQGFERIFAEVRRSGQPFVAQEMPIRFWRHAELELLYISLSIYPLSNSQGAMASIVLVCTDVSHQLQAREQVQELNEELAAINEELRATNEELGDTNQQLTRTNVDLDNFIYTASHDLKAPITNIEGLLLALQSELTPATRVGEVTFILNLMQDSVERFKRTIEHLTDISRLQKEHGQVATPVRLTEVIENVCLDLAPLLQASEAQLDIEVSTFVTLTFSEKNLRSVVYNLLSNALKYRHPSRIPHVRILSWPQDRYQVLEVQDNGLGLDLNRERDLFTMFQRYHTHVEGSGIGLYMVKKMVENVGGRIEVQSQLDQGSTFYVYFPR